MTTVLPAERLLVLITGPSGVGKDTLIQKLVQHDDTFRFLTTATTRPMRQGEVDGDHYFFLTREDFLKRIGQGEVLEYSEHYGNFYGALLAPLQDLMAQGYDVIKEINWTGTAQIKERAGDNLLKIALLPPTYADLVSRHKHRAAELNTTVDWARLEKIKIDFKHMAEPDYIFTNEDMIGSKLTDYDHIVINDDLDRAVAEVQAHIQEARQQRL